MEGLKGTLQFFLKLRQVDLPELHSIALQFYNDDMKTIRKQMMMLLSANDMSAREISSSVGIGEKEVYGHLSHIARSIKSQGKKLVINPAECMGCGYIFEKRKRFTRPGRCPICKSEHIKNPLYRIR